MKKIRLTRTMVIDYEPDPKNYPPECDTIEKMAQYDIDNCEDYELLFSFDLNQDNVKYEIIEGEE